MTVDRERAAIRWGVPALLVASCAAATAVSLRTSTSPSVALGSHIVLALQLALIFFYGSLLLLVPLVRAVFDGDLPIELSLKGARWKERFHEVEREFLTRQAELAEAGLRTDLGFKKEVRALKEVLEEVDEAQEESLDRALSRIAAIEEKVMSPETRH